jgi:hypothetical protein
VALEWRLPPHLMQGGAGRGPGIAFAFRDTLTGSGFGDQVGGYLDWRELTHPPVGLRLNAFI